MKKILIILLLLWQTAVAQDRERIILKPVYAVSGFDIQGWQSPINGYTRIAHRYQWIAGVFDSTFHIPSGATTSLRTGGYSGAGGLFYRTTDSSVYTYTGTQWIKLRGAGVYTYSNGITETGSAVTLGGSLTGNTTIDGGGTRDFKLTTLDDFHVTLDRHFYVVNTKSNLIQTMEISGPESGDVIVLSQKVLDGDSLSGLIINEFSTGLQAYDNGASTSSILDVFATHMDFLQTGGNFTITRLDRAPTLGTKTVMVYDTSASGKWYQISVDSIRGTGSGTPGGSTTQVQYNNAGAFGGISGVTSDGTNMTFGSGNLRATSPRITTAILDANGNESIILTATGSAVNEWTLANGATGVNPLLTASGETNVGLNFLMKGTGTFNLTGNATQAAELRLYEDTDDGTNYTAFKTGTQAASLTYTLPTAYPAVTGYVLSSTDAGVMSWIAAGGATPAGNFGNVQLNRNGALATAASDSIDFESATGLSVKGDVRTTTSLYLPSSSSEGIRFGSTVRMYDDGTKIRASPSAGTWQFFTSGSNFTLQAYSSDGGSYFSMTPLSGTGSTLETLGSATNFKTQKTGANTFSVGDFAGAAKFNVLSTTEQTRILYDASNYFSTTIGSTGSATLNLVGTSPEFTFSDAVNVPDEAYGGGWNGNTEVPTKNAVYDQLESGYANKALSNLASVSINASLIPQTTLDLGGVENPWRHLYLYGSGTYSTTSLQITGTPTTARIITIPDATTTMVGTDVTQTVTNKRVTPRIGTTASSSSLTIASDDVDQYNVTALAANLTINAPSGTPTTGQRLIIRIKDNGTSRTLTWNAAFRAIGVTLPSSTTISKTIYSAFFWNEADSKWDALVVQEEL